MPFNTDVFDHYYFFVQVLARSRSKVFEAFEFDVFRDAEVEDIANILKNDSLLTVQTIQAKRKKVVKKFEGARKRPG